MNYIMCSLCSRRHTDRYLCDHARAILAAAIADKKSYDMPTVDFDTPLDLANTGMGLTDRDSVFRQIVVQAAVIESAGAPFPALMFTGRDLAGHTMPRWLYTSTADDVLGVAALVQSRAELAVSQAAGKRGG